MTPAVRLIPLSPDHSSLGIVTTPLSAPRTEESGLLPAVDLPPVSQNEISGNTGPEFTTRASPPHCALIRTTLMRADARSVKSTGCDGFGIVNVTVTGLNVPNGNCGIVTLAFVALTTESPCSPAPKFCVSTVTEFGPGVIAWK